MTLIERVSEWPAEWRREGLEQGLEHERALLQRMAARKFGDDAGQRLAEALADVADPERLEQVGVWIIECGTEPDLLARVRDSNRRGN